MAFIKYEEHLSNNRERYFKSKEFKELLEELNIHEERVDGKIVFSGPQASLNEIARLVEEIDKDEKQPGRSELHLASKIEESRSDLHSFTSLDSMLDAQYKVTQKEIEERNKIKGLDIFNTRNEIQEMEREYKDIEKERAAIEKSIQRKRKELDGIEKFIKEKTNLILNRIITDPDEIATIQDLIDIKSKQASDIVEEIDRESKQIEAKMTRHKQLHCFMHDKQHLIDECERVRREDEETKKRQQEEIDSLPIKTARRLLE